jgi:hypothetical protein
MDIHDFKSLVEAYSQVYEIDENEEFEIDEATAMAKKGHDETEIRNKIAKNTGGGESADRATKLANTPTYGNNAKQNARDTLARKQRGDFRNTNSSNPGLKGYAHKSNDPAVKAKQAARGAQRGSAALTPNERQQLNMGEAVYGGSTVYGGSKPEPQDTRKVVTNADKKANTKAWQNYKSGNKGYKAADHVKEDIDIATEYFYQQGLNEYGIDILVEKLGDDEFCNFVFDIAEEYILTEQGRAAKRRSPSKSYDQVKAEIDAKEASKKQRKVAVKTAAVKQPEKEPVKQTLRDKIAGHIRKGIERHNAATATAGRLAKETGKTLSKAAKGAGYVAGQFGSGAGTVAKASKRAVVGEEVEEVDEKINLTTQSSKRKSLGKYKGEYESPKEFRKTEIKDAPYQSKGNYNAHLSKEEVELEEGQEELKQRNKNEMQRKAGNLGREVVSSNKGPKRTAAMDRMGKLVSAIGRDDEQKRFKTLGQSPAHNEEVDLFDTIIEFLCVEGYAETLEEAEWIMANELDAEDIDSILNERKYDRDEKLPGSGKTPREKMERKRGQHAARVMLGNPALGRSPRNDPERDSYSDRARMMDRVKKSQDKGEEPRDDEGRKNLIKAARRPRASYEKENRPGGLRAGNTKAGGHRTLVKK